MISAYLLAFLIPRGAVQLHVTDAHGKPIPNRKVSLAETNSTKPIRPFGIQYWASDEHMNGITNASGDVTILHVRPGKPMMVLVNFGPRFAPYLQKQHAGDPPGYHYPTLDVMKLDGAVYAGHARTS